MSQPNQYPSSSNNNKSRIAMFLLLVAMIAAGMVAGFFLNTYLTNKKASANEQLNEPTAVNANNATDKDEKADTAADKKAVEQPVLTVETIVPTVGQVKLNLQTDGTVVPKDTASVSGRVAGVAIERVLVNEGDWVKKGQPLAIFDTQTLQQNVIQAQAAVAQAQASYANARATVERVRPLLDIDAVSQQEVDSYITVANQAQASLVSAQAQLKSQQLTLNNAKVVAPVSGIISEKSAQVGAIPQGALFTIIQGGSLQWQAQINPQQRQNVNVGTPVLVNTTNGQTVQGRVERIDPVADNNRKINVYTNLEANKAIQSGMLLSGEFVFGVQDKIVVPVASVVSFDGYDYLMMVTDVTVKEGVNLGRVKRHKITLGDQYGDMVVVTSPVPKDALLVRQGGSFLNEGDLVRVAKMDQPETISPKSAIEPANPTNNNSTQNSDAKKTADEG